MLGRGRLNVPAHALDATIAFVRSQLRPEDRVGVLAYLHLLEPTTDHAAVVRLLERYRAQHGAIEDNCTRDRDPRGPGAPSWPTPPDTQAAIEALFEGLGLPPVQQFPAGAGGTGSQFNDGISLMRSLGAPWSCRRREAPRAAHRIPVHSRRLVCEQGGGRAGQRVDDPDWRHSGRPTSQRHVRGHAQSGTHPVGGVRRRECEELGGADRRPVVLLPESHNRVR